MATIVPRSPDLAYDRVRRHWYRDSVLATHLANGVNLLFPLGERAFVRSVRAYLDQVADASARADVQAFFRQEGRHAREHERMFAALEAQGFEIRRFLAAYDRVAYGLIDPVAPPILRLSVTVALEHFTAILAESALGTDLLDGVDPQMQALLQWHAAEELEHKAVAFDVLAAVDPRYRVRMAGLLVATTTLAAFWLAATVWLLAQDDDATARRLASELREIQRRYPIGRRMFVRGIRSYVKRDFHPSSLDNLELAKAYLASGRFQAAS